MPEFDSTTRFTDRAADYVRYRPTYPRAAYEAIVEGLGDPHAVVAADIGAGTGISARGLAELVLRVHAVEPNAAMRAAAAPHPRVEWRDGTAEATRLENASVDLVVCAQAYHWFDPERACREFGRILRPGGRLALVWNDGDESTPVAGRYYDLVREASTDQTLSHKTVAVGPRVAAPFPEPRVMKVPNEQRLDLDGLVGRAMSASYVPKGGPAADRLIGGLRELHAEHAAADGRVSFMYLVWIYTAERA